MKDSLKNQAYNYIRDRIINCEYKPLTFIDAALVARELGVSRTPVRDAITQLEQEGLVMVTPRHGIVVSDILPGEIEAISKTRRLIEPYAVAVACEKADADTLAAYRERFLNIKDRMDQIRAEYDFNHYLISLTENDYMITTMESVYTSNLRVQIMDKIPLGKTDTIIELIDRLAERDCDGATGAVIRHISSQGIY